MSAQALWITGHGQVELRETALVQSAPKGHVHVHTLYSGISRGTERLVLAGAVPKEEYSRMRAPHQDGEFPFPVKYGYSNVGTVVTPECPLEGPIVFCLYPHQSEFVVDEHAVIEVPKAVPARRATLAANMETALNAVWDARPIAGDRVSVVGAGVVGCLLLSLLGRSLALDVEVVDVNERRAVIAQAFGCTFRTPSCASSARDIVFHTTATQAGLDTCLRSLRLDGTVVELSWYGATSPRVALGGAFHSQRLRLLSSQVGHVSPHKPGWTYRERLALALSLLQDDRLDLLLNTDLNFVDLPHRYADVCSGSAEADAPAHCIRYT